MIRRQSVQDPSDSYSTEWSPDAWARTHFQKLRTVEKCVFSDKSLRWIYGPSIFLKVALGRESRRARGLEYLLCEFAKSNLSES